MAINFRELSPMVQVLIFVALGVLIVVGFNYVPGSPLEGRRAELAAKKTQADTLDQEVGRLKFLDQKRVELNQQIDALKRQLEIARTIVPEEKEQDEFIRILQGEASAAGVAIRRLTAKPVNPREYYNEMPFEIEADGPYYSVLDFFARLGRVPRVINVTDLAMTGIEEAKGRKKYPTRPGTTVTGTFTATTFFTKGAEGPAAKQPGKQTGGQPGKR
jgi:type IV pilus assembly protein PilO